jgi:hypothetical protein
MLLLLLAPLCGLYCFIQARYAGLKPLGWAILGAMVGPFALPLLHNHKRLQLRKAIGHGKVWFKP